jgi:hypothetical protein
MIRWEVWRGMKLLSVNIYVYKMANCYKPLKNVANGEKGRRGIYVNNKIYKVK